MKERFAIEFNSVVFTELLGFMEKLYGFPQVANVMIKHRQYFQSILQVGVAILLEDEVLVTRLLCQFMQLTNQANLVFAVFDGLLQIAPGFVD